MSWKSVGGGGGALALISTTTATADGSVDIALPAGHVGGLVVRGVLTGSDADLRLGCGDTAIDTGSNYDFVQAFHGDSDGDVTTDGGTFIPISTVTATDAFVYFDIMPGYDDAALNTGFHGRGVLMSGTTQIAYMTSGQYMVDAAIDLMRLTPSAGTITGSILLYGFGS